MYAVAAVSLVLILLLALFRTREHLEMNDKIKRAHRRGEYDKVEGMRRYAMAPEEMKQAFLSYAAKNPQNPFGSQPPNLDTPDDVAAFGISRLVDMFVEMMYEPATTPITVETIDAAIAAIVSHYPDMSENVRIQSLQNGNARKLLISYFIGDEPKAAEAPKAPEAPEERLVLTETSDFGQAVEIFKYNYIQYRTTGKTHYRDAYENAQKWIEDYLSRVNTNIEKSGTEIKDFMTKYASSGSEIGDLGASLKEIRRDGPALQNKYETIKRIQAEESKPDYTAYYVKGGIAAALLGVGAVVSFL